MTDTHSASKVLQGKLFADDRGTLRFFKDFSFADVKRFYQVENFALSTIRAFHGHMREGKYVYVTAGSALVCVVALDDAKSPSRGNKVERFVLTASDPQIIFVPPGNANGFKCLEEGTRVIFFSTATLEESHGDDHRFPFDYWGAEIWNVTNR